MNELENILNFIATTDDLTALKKIRTAVNKSLKTESKKVPAKYSDWSYKLAQMLWVYVHTRYPFTPSPNLEQWADDIDKINRVDGFDPRVVQAVLQWSQNDSFWRKQVRSGANLRKHFVTMGVNIKEGESKKGAAVI